MKDRGESFLKMFFQMMGQAMAMQSNQKNSPSDLELLVALVAKDRATGSSELWLEQFENMEGRAAVGHRWSGRFYHYHSAQRGSWRSCVAARAR